MHFANMTVRSQLLKLLQQEDINFLLTNRIPRRLLTRLVGWLARIEQPLVRDVSLWAWQLFSDLDLSEAKKTAFTSVRDCFTRELKDGARSIDPDPALMTSPCDAIVGACGAIEGTKLYQIKGFPYRLEDLIALLDERMGKLENRSSRLVYHKLIARIQTVRNNPRYAFMFENANLGGDTMVDILAQLFRLPPEGKPMTIMQLAGFPAEVIDSVASVLCRVAFDFGVWSEGAAPLLLVCEEAHRYAPADAKLGFGPTRRALSRIAKEGRKYGVYLGLITQRP